jgi:hypothetical protein
VDAHLPSLFVHHSGIVMNNNYDLDGNPSRSADKHAAGATAAGHRPLVHAVRGAVEYTFHLVFQQCAADNLWQLLRYDCQPANQMEPMTLQDIDANFTK